MRLVRFEAGGKIGYGLLDGEIVRGLKGDPFAGANAAGPFTPDGAEFGLSETRLLAPCQPSKIVAIGANYRSHIEEAKLPTPIVPLLFLKPPSSVIGPGENIVLPRSYRRVDYEGELGVVIGKKAKYVPVEQARNYILGYTCFNDVSERYNQKEDVQWTRAKSYDTFAATGPWIETELDPGDLRLETYLNGELRQSARTSEFVFGIGELVSFISGVMTLLPGDLIATGTPAGVGRMKPGDTVEVRIEGIGTLRNSVSEE